jgi:hypothetical protein
MYTAEHISIYDDRISTRDVDIRIGALQSGMFGPALNWTQGWGDEWQAEWEECAMWERLREAAQDAGVRWDEGLALIQADVTRDDDGTVHVNLPASYAMAYYEQLYDGSEEFSTLSGYVDWQEVAGDLVSDMVQVTMRDHNGDTRYFYTEG